MQSSQPKKLKLDQAYENKSQLASNLPASHKVQKNTGNIVARLRSQPVTQTTRLTTEQIKQYDQLQLTKQARLQEEQQQLLDNHDNTSNEESSNNSRVDQFNLFQPDHRQMPNHHLWFDQQAFYPQMIHPQPHPSFGHVDFPAHNTYNQNFLVPPHMLFQQKFFFPNFVPNQMMIMPTTSSKNPQKAMLPPRYPGEQPTFVNHKQAARIIIMRQKKAKKLVFLAKLNLPKPGRIKCTSRVNVAKRRNRLLNGRFQTKEIPKQE